MSAMNSDTLSKMRALREAKRIGCSGAHKTSDGKWHPCASAESLRSIDPKRLIPKSPLIVEPNRRRDYIGTAKIKKQWENLGQRGIVAIDTISGGGLISGSIGKSALAPPRDEDPDVFTDIEAARNRARQLGCIGVSRRTSITGRTIWMPCTNMSDLANRTGRTALGRRNMQRQAQRFVTDAMKRREREASRKKVRQKSLFEDLHNVAPGAHVPYRVKSFNDTHIKALGPRIGRGLRSAPDGMTFVDVTGAIDADKDGIVFEGKPLERPIIPKFILPDGVARRVQKLIQGTAEQNEKNRRVSGSGAIGEIDANQLALIVGMQPQEIDTKPTDPLLNELRAVAARSRRGTVRAVDTESSIELLPPVDAGVEFSKQAKRLGKRQAMSFYDKIADVGDDYLDYSYGEIALLVESAVPTTEDELRESLKSNPYSKKNWKKVLERITSAEVDWEAQEKMRNMLMDEIRREPILQEMIRRYGMPPLVATKWQPDIENLGRIGYSFGPSYWGSTIGGWSGAGFIGINRDIIPGENEPGDFRRTLYQSVDAPHTMRHELAHAWETMAARKGGPARERFIAQYQEISEGLIGILERGEDTFQTSYHSAPWGTEAEHRSAIKISEYAETARIEWFAESFAALTSSSPSDRAKVDRLSTQNIAAVLGISPMELVSMSYGRIDTTLGVNYSARSARTPINRLLGKPNQEVNDAVEFLRTNPQYIEDAPDELLLRLSPQELNDALRTHSRSMRSITEPDASTVMARAQDARTRGDLGQKVIDFLVNQATKPNQSDEYATMWFIGGTTGSGKTTLRNLGVLDGVPDPSTAVDLDPDIIKTMHPDWNGGKGAQQVHKWSTQWTKYGLRQIMASQRDAVVSGTGVRTDQLELAKRNGYLTVGHYVYVPTDKAKANMRNRAISGGTNLPEYFADRYARELSDKIPRAITSGLLDEFYLWDNSGDEPVLAAFRTRDGKFEIRNRRAFEGFLGKRGAEYVEQYWKDELAGRVGLDATSASTSQVISRSISSRSVRRSVLTGARKVGGLDDTDFSRIETKHSIIENTAINPRAKLDSYDWFGSEFRKVSANLIATSGPVFFESADIQGSSFKGFKTGDGSIFSYSRMRGVDFSGSQLNGADFRNSVLSNVDFTSASLVGARFRGAQLKSVDFSGADLRDSDLSVDDVVGSGIKWSSTTKFPPEVDAYLKSADTIKHGDGKLSLNNKAITTHAFSRAGGKYDGQRMPKRSSVADLARGPRRALYDARTKSESGLSVQGTDISDADLSYQRIINLSLSEVSLNNPQLEGTDLSGSTITSSIIRGAHGNNVSLSKSTLDSVSITNSFLPRLRMGDAVIVGRLDLSGSDLRSADFSRVTLGTDGRKGKIRVNGADLRGADLTGIPLSLIESDSRTQWEGARLPHIPFAQLPPNLRGKVISGRSSRALGHREMMERVNEINDISMTFSSMTATEKDEARRSLLGTYRSLFETAEEIVVARNELQFLDQRRNLVTSSLEKFSSIVLPDNSRINLIQDVENGNKSSFVNKFSSIPAEIRSQFQDKTPSETWSTISSLLSTRDSLNSDIDDLENRRSDMVQALSLADTLYTTANADSRDIKPLTNVSVDLPQGKKVGPLSSRSVREEQPFTSREYIGSLYYKDKIDEVFDTFPDIAESKESLENRYAEFAYEFDNQLNEILSGRYDDIPAHPLAGSSLIEAVNNTKIVVYSDGTNSIVAPANQLLANILPDKRDWSSVELPDKDTVLKAKRLLDSSDEEISDRVASPDDTMAIAQSVAQKLIDYISQQLATVDRQQTRASFMRGMSPFLMDYLRVLNDPHDWAKGLEPESISGIQAILALHDGLGHSAIGRGFDRHGEWAVAMAMLSLVRDNTVNLLEDERQAYGREVLARFGSLWLAKRLGGDSSPTLLSDFMYSIYEYDGDIFDIIDVLDPRDVKSRVSASSRSSRNEQIGILTPEQIQEVARIEARDRLIRDLRNRRLAQERPGETRKQRRSKRRRARTDRRASARSQRLMDILGGEELQVPENVDYSSFPLGVRAQASVGEVRSRIKSIARNLTSGSLYEVSIHPDLDSRRKELLDSLIVDFDEDGIAMLMADPHPIFSPLLARERNWQNIRIPDIDTLEKLFDLINDSPKTSDAQTESQDLNDDFEPSEPIEEQISNLIDGLLQDYFGEDWRDETPITWRDGKPDLGGLREDALRNNFAGMWYGHLKYPSVDPLSNSRDYAHDIIGHIATGRGFDRHGEWANAVAMLDMILHSDLIDASDEERNKYAKKWFVDYGLTHLQRAFERLPQDKKPPMWVTVMDDYGLASLRINGRELDMKQVMDLLAPINAPSLSMRSSRSSKLGDAPDSAIAQVARDEVAARKLRRPNREMAGSRSRRLDAKPRLTVDADGKLSISGKNMSLAEIAGFDYRDIEAKDLPKNFFPGMPDSMRLLHARQEITRWQARNVLTVNDDGTLSASRLNDEASKHGSTLIFKQDIVAGLKDGEFLIVRDLPGDIHNEPTKMAVVTRVGRDLVAIEVDPTFDIPDIEKGLSELKDSSGGPIGEYSVSADGYDGTERFSRQQIEKLLPSTSPGSLIDQLSVVLDYQAQISSVDGDLPRPSILLKRSIYGGFVTMPQEEIDRYGGQDAVRRKIAGIAFSGDDSFTMYQSGSGRLNPSLMTHEWSHVVDEYRGYFDEKMSDNFNWQNAGSLDEQHGKDLLADDEDLRLAASEKRLRHPGIQAGERTVERSPGLTAVIGQSGVTPYGKTNKGEDFAEASSLFVLDKTYGYVLQETDANGKPIPGGRTWTFAELFPHRAQLLELAIYRDSRDSELATPMSGRSSRSFDKRFKNAYGNNVPQGDGDCFVAATEMVDRLVSSEFGIDRSQIKLVHGIPLGTGGEAGGMRFPHAWVEVHPYDMDEHERMQDELRSLMLEATGDANASRKQQLIQRINTLRNLIMRNEMMATVYDYSNGNEAVVPRALYYAIGNIDADEARYYSMDELNEMIELNGHYGPWD